jgi:rubrerythrin
MSNVKISEIIDFAIKEEVGAYNLYIQTAKKLKTPALAGMLQDLARMEKNHEARLQAFKKGKLEQIGGGTRAVDLKITDYLVATPLKPESSLQEVLVFAMKAEQKAQDLYGRLSKLSVKPEAAALFLDLSLEEAKHKSDLENAYDENILQEN